MSLGAPPGLLQDSIRAMEDEVEHARLSFGLARKFSGEAVGPGPMDLASVLAQPIDPASILTAAIIEGCFEETISARYAAVALDRAEDANVRDVLTRIVADELTHADLSWRFVKWMLEVHPELAATAEGCFLRGLLAPETAAEEPDLPILEKYGHLRPATKRKVRQETIRHEIAQRIVTILGHDPRVSMLTPLL